jgi:nucleosome binding factor SPN SPT16 subunit
VISKDQASGKFALEYKDVMETKNVEQVDVSTGIAVALAVKDEDELVSLANPENHPSSLQSVVVNDVKLLCARDGIICRFWKEGHTLKVCAHA